MSVISDLIAEIRTEISDDDSTRFTDDKILRVIRKAVRRANRIVQRNGLQFGKKMTPLTTVAAQDYLTLSTSATDFDVLIGLWRADTQVPVPFPPEPIWEQSQAPDALTMANISYADDKIKFKGTPASALTLNLWYYPTVGAESMTVGSTLP